MYHLINVIASYAAFCGLVGAVALIGTIVYNIFIHPLRRYPGPKLWAATRLPWAYSLQSGSYHHRLKELHDQYGPIVRIAPNELSYIDAQAWKDIYSTRPGHHAPEKNRVWAKEEEAEGSISIVSADEDVHKRNRRALMGAFTEHAVREHASVLESHVGLLVEKFEEAVMAGQGHAVVDMVDWLNFLAFDISGTLSFGESFDSVKNGKAHPWVDISCSFGKGVALMAAINFFAPLNRLLQYAMPARVMQKMEYHKQLAKEKVLQRLAMQGADKRQDYVGSITRYNQEKGQTVIPPKELETNMTLLIFAGSETTSSAMAAILNQLVRNVATLRKLEDEVRHAFEDESEITVSSVNKLDYLNAVIQEGIRLGPPAAIGLPRVVSQGGETICGQMVPAGTFVAVNQYPAYRSAANFTRPDDFIPERFIEGIEGDTMAVFEPFLIGRHKCIGQKLAWAEIRLTLARLIYSFDMSAAEEASGVRDFGEQRTFIFWEKMPLRIALKLRS